MHDSGQRDEHDGSGKADDRKYPAPAEPLRQGGDDQRSQSDAEKTVAGIVQSLIEPAPPRRRDGADRRLADRPADAVAKTQQVADDEHRQEIPRRPHRRRHQRGGRDRRQQNRAAAVIVGKPAADPTAERPGDRSSGDQQPRLPQRHVEFGHDLRKDEPDTDPIEPDAPPEEDEQDHNVKFVGGRFLARHRRPPVLRDYPYPAAAPEGSRAAARHYKRAATYVARRPPIADPPACGAEAPAGAAAELPVSA